MKITRNQIKSIVKEAIDDIHNNIVKFSKQDMESLHTSGQIEKDGVYYQYQEPIDESLQISEQTSNKDLLKYLGKLLKQHDWWHYMSDSHSVWKKGSMEMKLIRSVIGRVNAQGLSKDAEKLWKAYSPKEFHKHYPHKLTEGKINEAKRRELKIPTMDKIKTDKVLKKLKLKPGKDYDIGYGDRNTFLLDMDVKHLDKVITYLMQNRIRVN